MRWCATATGDVQNNNTLAIHHNIYNTHGMSVTVTLTQFTLLRPDSDFILTSNLTVCLPRTLLIIVTHIPILHLNLLKLCLQLKRPARTDVIWLQAREQK